jgi:pilus assembly protein Flp/PilA
MGTNSFFGHRKFYVKKLKKKKGGLINMMNQISKFMKEDKGQGMTEYGLILGVIAIGAIAAFGAFGDSLVAKVNAIKTSIFGAQ